MATLAVGLVTVEVDIQFENDCSNFMTIHTVTVLIEQRKLKEILNTNLIKILKGFRNMSIRN